MTLREWAREKGSPILTLMVASVIIGGSVGFAARAHADVLDDYAIAVAPVICTELDVDPTFAGIETAGTAIVNAESFTYRQAGRVIATAVLVVCPRHARLIAAYVDAYRPGEAYVA